MKFDDKALKAERISMIEKIDPSVLNKRINYDYPEGELEITKYMTFVPEEDRLSLLQAFVESLLQQ